MQTIVFSRKSYTQHYSALKIKAVLASDPKVRYEKKLFERMKRFSRKRTIAIFDDKTLSVFFESIGNNYRPRMLAFVSAMSPKFDHEEKLELLKEVFQTNNWLVIKPKQNNNNLKAETGPTDFTPD